MDIIGIHDGHSASACLLREGKIEFAIQEERLSRIKNHSTFPRQAIQSIFSHSGLTPKDIDHLVFSSRYMPANKNRDEIRREYIDSAAIQTHLKRALKKTPVFSFYARSRNRKRLQQAVRLGFSAEKIVSYDHHLCHAAAAYFGSPWWRDEPVLILTNDAGGDDLCATVSIGRNGKISRLHAVSVSESIGYIYSMITALLGMIPEEHEYKVMGMAPYSSSEKHRQLQHKFERLLVFDPSTGGMTWHRAGGCPHAQYSYRFLQKLTEAQRFDWICGAVQDFTEDFLVRWVQNSIQATGIRKVALGGGVFMNVKANKRIMELDEVDSLFVFPSCGDESNAMGAAFLQYAQEKTRQGAPVKLQHLDSFCYGPEFSDDQIASVLKQHSFSYRSCSDIETEVAGLLNRGEVVARFEGRMEFGARALGNRSILANPSDRDSIRTINDIIKNRDFWMPFAPSILSDRQTEYFMNPKKISAPYMILSFNTNGNVQKIIAACHPYDFTIRPQVVSERMNPSYYRLISIFHQMSGIGGVLNTSFNLHGYPIVCSPADAMDVFSRSGLKYMAVGRYLVEKPSVADKDRFYSGQETVSAIKN